MRRLIPLLILALLTLGVSVGEMEPGPDVEVEVPSGETVSVATWVMVVRSERHFEAHFERNPLLDDRDATYRNLRHIRSALAGNIADARATDIMVAVCTDSVAPTCATCWWPTVDSDTPKTCFHSDDGLARAVGRRLTSGCS